jgi:hypothetical protein
MYFALEWLMIRFECARGPNSLAYHSSIRSLVICSSIEVVIVVELEVQEHEMIGGCRSSSALGVYCESQIFALDNKRSGMR